MVHMLLVCVAFFSPGSSFHGFSGTVFESEGGREGEGEGVWGEREIFWKEPSPTFFLRARWRDPVEVYPR